MTGLEEHLAKLLKDAAGEPPVTLDPDSMAFGPSPRRRSVVSLLAAAAVLALAVPAAMRLERGSPHRAPADRPTLTGSPGHPGLPPDGATRAAETIIDTAPMVPGATQRRSAPLATLTYARTAPGG